MKKLIIIEIVAAVVVSAGILVTLKATWDDQATEIPGEESAEKVRNLQEENKRGESAEYEVNEIGEYGKK